MQLVFQDKFIFETLQLKQVGFFVTTLLQLIAIVMGSVFISFNFNCNMNSLQICVLIIRATLIGIIWLTGSN